jgi:hypothetical protein
MKQCREGTTDKREKRIELQFSQLTQILHPMDESLLPTTHELIRIKEEILQMCVQVDVE